MSGLCGTHTKQAQRRASPLSRLQIYRSGAHRQELLPRRLAKNALLRPATKVAACEACRSRDLHRIMGLRNAKRAASAEGGARRLEATMSEAKVSEKIYDVPPEWKQRAYIDPAKYQEMYARSLRDPNGFWAEQANRLDWYKSP